jgi:plastocyanin
MKRIVLLVALAVFALGVSACSENNKVGEGVDPSAIGGEGGDGAIRDTTTTEAPTTTAPPTTQAPATTRPVPTTKPPSTTQPVNQIALTIGIHSDTSGKNQFEPRQAGVQRGATVRWQNFDEKARSVEDSGGAFKSPLIPPGGTWDYKANTVGKFNYSDGTRPYAVGELNVV